MDKTGYDNIVTESLTIPTDDHIRDLDLFVPISEVTSDGRYITVEATDNTGTVTGSTTIYAHDPAFGPCCLAIVKVPMINVPANSTSINIKIITDRASNPTGSGLPGQSWVIAATVYADINCNCTNPPVANAGPDVTICSGNQVTLTAGSSGGTGSKSYEWNNGPTGSSQTVSPTSTTTYIVTATDIAGCDDADDVKVTVITNYTNPGIISGYQSDCGSYDPTLITNQASPTGGSGGSAIYRWQKRDRACGASWSSWSTISGATGATYNPPSITQTTQYRRRARRSNLCSQWLDSNPVTKVVAENYTNGGVSAGDESKCSSYNPSIITSTSDPSGGCGGDLLTNPFPGFPIDFLNNNCSWIDYDLGNDLVFVDNGNGSISIMGRIVDGIDADFDACNSSPCGSNDHWYLDMTLSDKQDHATFISNGGVPLVHSNCNALVSDLEFWDLTGTLTGLGCNSGRTINLNGPKAPHRLQLGKGGNSNDVSCDYSLSTWINTTEGGVMMNSDIYAFLDAPAHVWQKREYNCATGSYGGWTVIAGATDLTYDPSTITVTTQYRRRSSRMTGCSPAWAYANIITKEVVENYSSGGAISGDESQCSAYDPSTITSATDPSGFCGGTADIRWYKWEYNCTTGSWGSSSVISGATSLTYNPGPITATTRYRRYARRGSDCTGTNGSWMISNYVIKEIVEQYTDGGTIAGNEVECTSYNPALITNTASPEGGCGGTEYSIWQKREYNCATGAYGSWATQSGANALTFNPGVITVTSQYRRLSRRSSGCSPGWGYSNVVTKEVVTNFTDGGTIGSDESKCAGYDPALISSIADPSGGCGGTPYYYWQERTYDCANNTYSSWSKIGGNTLTLNPPAITQTTQYRRLAYRLAGCSPYWAYSNTITKEVVENYTGGGDVFAGQAQCGSFDPPLITSINDPVGGCGGTPDIRWYVWTQDCATGVWSSGAQVAGATSMTYDPPSINVSTRYRRYARRGSDCVGTNGSWYVSNFSYFYVQEDLADGGTISSDQEACGSFMPAQLIGTVPSGSCAAQTVTYQWQYRFGFGGDWTDIANSNSKDYQPVQTTVSGQYRRKVNTSSCGVLYSNAIDQIVNKAPTIDLDNDSYCAGSNRTLAPEVCVSYPDLSIQRPLDNGSWNNEYLVGGHKLTGDGSLCYKIESTTNSAQMLGLNTDPNSSNNYASIDYAIYTYLIPSSNTWTVQIRENGTSKGNISTGSDITGVEMCIRRTGTQVEYLLDGVVKYTSLIASSSDLYFDNSYLGTNNATWGGGYSNITDIKLCGETDIALSWNTGSSANDLVVSSAGTYTLTATDMKGCNISAQSVVTQDALPNATLVKNVDLTCTRAVSYIYSTVYYGTDFNWTTSDVQLSASGAPCGSNYLTLTGSTPYGIIGQSIGGVVSGGNTVEHNFKYRASGTGTGYARLVFYDAAWTNLGTITTQLTNTTTWTDEVVSAVAPANAVNVHFGIVAVTGRVIDYDCVEVAEVGGANFAKNPSFEMQSPYQWSGPNGARYGERGIYTTEPGTFNVTVTDPSTGCTATSSVVVTQDIAEPVSSISGPNQVCAAESGLYTATGTDVTFSWDFKGGVTADGDTDDASETVTWPNSLANTTRSVTCTVTGTNGCSKVYTHDVLITPEVFANAGPDVDMCQGGTVDLGATNSGPAGSTYTWTPNLFLDDNTASHPTANPPFDITYTLTTTLNGCTRSDQVSVNVDVDLNPIADAGPDKSAGIGHTVSIGGSPTGTIPSGDPTASISSYSWTPTSGLNDPNIANPTLTVGQSGAYQVVVETSTGCKDTSVMNITAINYGAVSGNVSEDIDNDDVGDTNLAGILITLINKADGSVYDSKSTDASGNYLFEDVLAGNYTVVEDDSSLDAKYRDVQDGDESDDGDNTDNIYNTDDEVSVVVAPGETDADNNFIEEQVGRIRGVVKEDTDNDDIGEVNLEGILITLIDKSDGSVYATRTTNVNGVYNFTNVEPGNYTVVQDDSSLAATYRDVKDGDSTDDGDPTDDTYNSDDEISVVLAPGEYDYNNDFLEEQVGRIRGQVKEDIDNDDVGELNLQGVVINLIDKSDGSVYATRTTNVNGVYVFTNVEPGNYTVVEDDSSLAVTYRDVKDGDSTDDGDPTDDTYNSDDEISVVLTPGEDDYNNDFLEEQVGSILGNVSEDTNNDDSGEVNLSGISITLIDKANGSTVASMLTNANGNYAFSEIAAGNYTVVQDDSSLAATYRDVQDGDESDDGDANDEVYNQDDQISVSLTPGEVDSNNDFIEEQVGRIRGRVMEDTDNDDSGDVALVGIAMTLIDKSDGSVYATMATNVNGYYLFSNVEPGNYTVVEDDSSLASTYADVLDGDSTDDGDPTDDTYNSDDEISVVLAPGEDDFDNDFLEEQGGRIRGMVREDIDNDDTGDVILVGIAITLIDKSDGSIVANTVTNVNGAYNFYNVVPGTYTVVQDDSSLPANYRDVLDGDSTDDGDPTDDTYNSDDEITVVMTPGEYDNNNDFVEEQIGNISGTVTLDTDNDNAGDMPITSIPIVLVNKANGQVVANTTTDNTGAYSFAGIEPGVYTVVENDASLDETHADVQDGDESDDGDANDNVYDTNDAITVVMAPGENDSDNNFIEEEFVSIGDFVWYDSSNGASNRYDQGVDQPMPSIQLKLYDGNGNPVIDPSTGQQMTTSTNSSGIYLFDKLLPGDYRVEMVYPSAAMTTVEPNFVADDTMDSDGVDTGNNSAISGVYILVGGMSDMTVDFGLTNVVVDVELLDFYGSYNKERNLNALEWHTATEINNEKFIIERSFNDADSFESIGEESGAGTVSSTQDYSFDDKDIADSGVYYYRLSQVDFDGKTTRSNTIAIRVEKSMGTKVSVYPNPARDYTTIDITSNEDLPVKITVFDFSGKLVDLGSSISPVQTGSQKVRLDLNDLPSGTYMVRTKIGERTFIKKLVITNN